MADFDQPVLRTTTFGQAGYQHPRTGELVPGVTSVSGLVDGKSWLTAWGTKVAATYAVESHAKWANLDSEEAVDFIKRGAKREQEVARNRGSLIHDTVRALCEGDMEFSQTDPETWHHLSGWVQWCQRFVDRFLLVEATIWNYEFGYAGTLDAMVVFQDGRIALVDYKTGSTVSSEAALQLSALRYADCIITTDGETKMPKVDVAGVLHLPAPAFTTLGKPAAAGRWSWREMSTEKEDFEVFLGLLKAHKWNKGRGTKVVGGKQTSLPTPPSTEVAVPVATALSVETVTAEVVIAGA